MYPAPIAVAEFRHSETIRMSFWQAARHALAVRRRPAAGRAGDRQRAQPPDRLEYED
jgi:hypothetical protein